MKFILYTDGGARENPGPAAVAAVLINEKGFKKTFSKYIGQTTNNQAEYQGLIFGLEKAKQLKVTEIDCYLDSELIVNQLNRKYKIKNKGLGPLFIKVWNLSQGFKKINFYYIPREKNKEADKLVNKTIKKQLKEK